MMTLIMGLMGIDATAMGADDVQMEEAAPASPPKEEKKEVRKLFEELREWLWENYSQDDEFWITNPYGWRRWEGILDWMDAEDHTNLIPDFQEYINTLDRQRGTDAKITFPELRHLL
jgi:hypothetical protein